MYSSKTPNPERDEGNALLAQVRDGNEAAYNTLVRSWAVSLYRFAYVLTSDAQMAEDIVQDVFVYVWERREQIDFSRNIKSYLFQSIRNRALNMLQHVRAQSRVETVVHEATVRTSANDGEIALEEEDLACMLREALATLPPRTREIFMLHREQGMSYTDIADVLGIGIPTIHNQMSRASKVVQAAISRWRNGG